MQLEVNPDKADEGMITAVLPRRNYLERPTVANLDLLVITLALVQPDFSFLIADKLLVLAEAANIPVLLVLTKADLAAEEQRESIADLYRKIGYETFVISSKTGEGIDALRRRLEGKVTAFGGPSGVGKSSALNAIQPGVLRTTGEISTKISRGKHTTRYTELIPFNGGYLADTCCRSVFPSSGSLKQPVNSHPAVTPMNRFAASRMRCRKTGSRFPVTRLICQSWKS